MGAGACVLDSAVIALILLSPDGRRPGPAPPGADALTGVGASAGIPSGVALGASTPIVSPILPPSRSNSSAPRFPVWELREVATRFRTQYRAVLRVWL